MKSVSQFSPASFLFQGVRPNITNRPAPTTTSTTSTTSTTTPTSSFGTDRATLGGGGGLSLGDRMKNLTTKVGKASGSWLQETRQDLGLTSKESKAFKGKHEGRGWDVKGSDNRADFTPQKMNGKPVSFRVKDEATGQMVEKKGFLKPSGEEGSSSFKLDGQKGEFDSKHIHDMAVNNDPNITKGSQGFRDKFEGQNWTSKNHRNPNDFFPQDMNGREVAFLQKDEKTGKMVEHRGIMKSDSDPNKSAMFKLEGQKGEFNNNYIKEMAVNDSFDKGMKKEGWTLQDGQNKADFSTGALHGREVAFKVRDAGTGKMVERRGVVDANSDDGSGKFKLKGQDGQFNRGDIKEMARNDKFAQQYGEQGWTVKDQHNADQFQAHNLQEGQNVAFRHPDPHTGDMMEKMGKIEAFSMVASMGLTMFSMVGMSGMYSSMMMPEMAMMPMDMGMGAGLY
jgi:hypothetical protein